MPGNSPSGFIRRRTIRRDLSRRNASEKRNHSPHVWHVLQPPEKLVFSWRWQPDSPETLVTLQFRDLGTTTEILPTHQNLPSIEERDKYAAARCTSTESFRISL